jgi:Zn-dependent metalloprotease
MRSKLLLALFVTFGLVADARAESLPAARLEALRAAQPARVATALHALHESRSRLGLGKRDTLVVRASFTNSQGQTVLHLDHRFADRRVWGSGAIAHVLPDGELRTLDASLERGVEVAGAPTPSSEKAIAIVLGQIEMTRPLRQTPEVEPIVFPTRHTRELDPRFALPNDRLARAQARPIARPTAPFVWAWEVRTGLYDGADGPHDEAYVVDAQSGTILHVEERLRRSGATPVKGKGNGFYRGQVSIDTSQMSDGSFALYDTTRGTLPNPAMQKMSKSGATGWSATGMQVWYEPHDTTGKSTGGDALFESNPKNTWGDGNLFTAWGSESGANGQTAGVDALSALQSTWDFLAAIFGRNGIDGLGTSIFAQVLLTEPGYVDISYWFPSAGGVLLGAGSYPGNAKGFQSSTDIDVIAHELMHGAVYFTSKFQGSGSTVEELTLDEATADFLGALVGAWAARAPDAAGDKIPDAGVVWQIGTNVGHGTPQRWLDKPSRDQRSVDAWFDGIGAMDAHFGAGPLNRALYFLAQGASSDRTSSSYSPYLPEGMKGIGNDAAARIWWKTVTERLLGSAAGTLHMSDARREAIAAAIDLYTNEPEKAAAVEDAFAAANIGVAHGAGPRTQVVFANWRNGDYIQQSHQPGWANRQNFPHNEAVRPRITVLNNDNTAVTWSLGGPSLGNDPGTSAVAVQTGGHLNPDGSWTTPNRLGWYSISATSVADPLEHAEGRCFVVDLDTDTDLEQDALDMGGIAFSWQLTNGLDVAHSVLEAPWVDDGDVSIFVDAVRAAWPPQ